MRLKLRNQGCRVGSRRMRVALLAAIVLCAVAVAAATTSAGGSTPRQQLAPDPAVTTVSPGRPAPGGSATIDPVLKSDLSVLRRPSMPVDELPSGLQQWVRTSLAQSAPNSAQSRRMTASNGAPVYVMPATNGVCVTGMDPTTGSFCAPVAALADGEAVALDLCSPSLPKGQIQMEWILPDAATSVAVRLSNGQTVSLAGRNVYIKRFSLTKPLPETIEWSDPGHRSVDTNIPPDAKSMKCVHPGDVSSVSQSPRPR